MFGAAVVIGDDSPDSPDRTESFEVGTANVAELPGGKEADGIIGDFVLRNSRLEALVAGNLPNRKANMSTNWKNPTPGCLYDLATRGSENDQLTCFAPGKLEGRISSVRVVSDGNGSAAQVRAERTAATGNGIHEVHDYVLDADAAVLRIASRWTNCGDKTLKVKPAPAVKGLGGITTVHGIVCGNAQNPMDRQGYAWTALDGNFREADLAPGDTREVDTIVAPGNSPAAAFGWIAQCVGDTGVLRGRVIAKNGCPVLSATIDITFKTDGRKETVTKKLPAYPRHDGSFEVALPPGRYPITVRDVGRESVQRTVTIAKDATVGLDVEMGTASRVHFVVTEGMVGGQEIPCKVQFLGVGATADPDFGVHIQAHGCSHQYHSETGNFSLQAPPGKYRVIVTHGIEYSHHEDIVDLKPGEEATVHALLERVVDTRGWVSTDYHNHSTPSGDNYCGTDDRVINLVAEHIEFAPTTEHNRLYDWAPHIRRLGLEREISTIVGLELTGPNAHFNTFPLQITPHAQDNGAPVWVEDPRIDAIILRDFGGGGPDRWVHLNHPHVGKFFRDRNADGVADGGYPGLENLVDAAEVWSTEILNLQPTYRYTNANGVASRRENRTFAWLQLLNRGRRLWCIAVSDAHSVFGNGVGGWRTYVPSSDDRPDHIDFRELIRNSKAGKMFVTNGPFIEARLDDGTMPGGSTRATGAVTIDIRVQTTTWIDIDRVQILVNGRPVPELNFTRAKDGKYFHDGVVSFEVSTQVKLGEDAHLIVAALGEQHDLATGYGTSWQSSMHPCGFTNPIFVDTDGDGFTPNGDTLGHPLPLGRY